MLGDRIAANKSYAALPGAPGARAPPKREATAMPGMMRMPPPPGWMQQGVKALEEKLNQIRGIDKFRHHANMIGRSSRFLRGKTQQQLTPAQRVGGFLLQRPLLSLAAAAALVVWWLLLGPGGALVGVTTPRPCGPP